MEKSMGWTVFVYLENSYDPVPRDKFGDVKERPGDRIIIICCINPFFMLELGSIRDLHLALSYYFLWWRSNYKLSSPLEHYGVADYAVLINDCTENAGVA